MVALGSGASSEKSLSQCVQAEGRDADNELLRLWHKAQLSATSLTTLPIWPFQGINGQPFHEPLR